MFDRDVDYNITVRPFSSRYHLKSVERAMNIERLKEYVELVLFLPCEVLEPGTAGVEWFPFN